MSLSSRVLRTLRKHEMVPTGGRVLVAVSGGPDSVALLDVLRELEGRGELVVCGIAHFNHHLRGAAADADERFCRELAAALGVRIEVGSGDVRARAQAERRSLEDTARVERYAFLEAAATRLHADAIAVGHSLDDQAETFLLRLLRGAAARGLAGIRPKAGRVIRPLIEISRDDLRAYASARRLAFREDETNADVSIARNRVRHELLPRLRAFSSALVDVLAREADTARVDEDFLAGLAIDFAATLVLVTERGIEVDLDGLRALHPALASRIVRDALERAAPGRFFGRDHIAATLALTDPAGGAAVSAPGLTARREGNRIVLGAPPAEPFANSFRVPLSIPGEVALAGWAVSAQQFESPGSTGRPGNEEQRPHTGPGIQGAVAVAGSLLRLPLAVRSRRPGDRFKPLGMAGRGRKLQDFLVDRKVARAERDTLPLVVDSDDRIVWVVGQSVAEDFRVTGPSQGVILLIARRLGGVG